MLSVLVTHPWLSIAGRSQWKIGDFGLSKSTPAVRVDGGDGGDDDGVGTPSSGDAVVMANAGVCF